MTAALTLALVLFGSGGVTPPEPAPPAAVKVHGDATWYCVPGVSACHRSHSGGLYAAAGSELRIGKWRGRYVNVCQGADCVRVKLIDWCACKGDRVIDLYGDAFRRLAPLSAGVIRVTVSWSGKAKASQPKPVKIKLPETDAAQKGAS